MKINITYSVQKADVLERSLKASLSPLRFELVVVVVATLRLPTRLDAKKKAKEEAQSSQFN